MAVRDILHIEDDPDIACLVHMSLDIEGGFTVRLASDGASALASLAKGEYLPDAVLLDGQLPGMSAPHVITELRANPHTARIPIIMLTASTRAELHRLYVDLGAVAVLVKPFDPLTLGAKLKALLRTSAS